MSARANVVESLESVNVMVAVCEPPSVAWLEAMVTVGATVSMMIGTASPPPTLKLAASSLKVQAGTETLPGTVELAAGVKIAV